VTNHQPEESSTRSWIFGAIFFVIFIFLLYQMAGLLGPFASALTWAAMLTLAGYPLFLRLMKLLRGRRGLSASIMSLLILLVIVGPSLVLLITLASQALSLYQWASEFISSGRLAEWETAASSFIGRVFAHPALSGMDVSGVFVKALGELSAWMAGQAGDILKNTLVLAFDLVVMLLAVFFFYRDGESYYRFLMELLPFTAEQKQVISGKFIATFRAVINGVLFIALLQGALTGIGFAICGVPFAVFWGVVAAVAALFPIGGAALVWAPGALFLFLTGGTFHGIVLSAWGVVFVTLPDSVLKPLLIGRKADIPPFFLLMGILGGLKVFGMLGILFGPLIVTLLTVFIQIYRKEYAEQ